MLNAIIDVLLAPFFLLGWIKIKTDEQEFSAWHVDPNGKLFQPGARVYKTH